MNCETVGLICITAALATAVLAIYAGWKVDCNRRLRNKKAGG